MLVSLIGEFSIHGATRVPGSIALEHRFIFHLTPLSSDITRFCFLFYFDQRFDCFYPICMLHWSVCLCGINKDSGLLFVIKYK